MKKFLPLLLFSIFTHAFAQEENYSLSLQEAIDFALENNRAAKNASLDIAYAKAQKKQTTAIGLPQINGSIDYQNWLKQQVSILPGELAGGTPGTYIAVPFGTKQSATASATLTQKIFDGAYIVGLQSAKVFLEISENAKEKTDLEIRKAVINAYTNVLLTEESNTIVKNNIEVVKKNLNETQKIVENGLAEEENVEQLEITLSGLQSYANRINRYKDIAYKMLKITIGMDVESNLTLTDALQELVNQNMSLELIENPEDIESTIDYKIALNNKISNELLVKLEKSKYLPTLDAFVNGGYNANNEKFKFLNSNQKWYGSSLLGVSLKIPIFSSGMRKASTKMAKINLEQSELNLIETEQNLKLQIAAAKSDYLFTIEDYQNKKQNLALAQRIQQKNEIKFFEGISSSFNLRQAQTQLYNAQEEYLQAMIDVLTAKTELETLLNTPNY